MPINSNHIRIRRRTLIDALLFVVAVSIVIAVSWSYYIHTLRGAAQRAEPLMPKLAVHKKL